MPQKPSTPLVFIAFGITGELMKRKIVPAILKLREKKELPDNFKIIGISRRPADEMQTLFGESFCHIQGDAGEPETYTQLKELLDSFGPAQKIFYISTSPALYPTIFEHLAHLAAESKNPEQMKLMIEKPFGLSGTEAARLSAVLHRSFNESQIYRVDHYLAKESLRLKNISLELIQKVEAYFCETDGVEKRGASYDAVGALRDVGQNHLLEMLAVTLMQNRVDFLEELGAPAEHSSHEQYAGYQDIPGVAPSSKTETEFSCTFAWRGIPITIEGGKYLPENKKEVVVTQKDGKVLHFPVLENTHASEYELLILDCVRGDHTLFVSERELALLWRFVDPIVKVWYQ
ncbi:MAG: hypothetical protein WCI89_01515 [bacterium]